MVWVRPSSRQKRVHLGTQAETSHECWLGPDGSWIDGVVVDDSEGVDAKFFLWELKSHSFSAETLDSSLKRTRCAQTHLGRCPC